MELLGKVRDRSLCTSELLQNAASGGIRERGERSIKAGACTLNHMVQCLTLLFAHVADMANALFIRCVDRQWWLPLFMTPLGFAGIAWVDERYAPEAAGSGIPQVIAAAEDPVCARHVLISLRAALFKFVFTIAALCCGASVGREGPTVQISAAILSWHHRVFRAPMRASLIIAGGAAGVAAAFNTPLAGRHLRDRGTRRRL